MKQSELKAILESTKSSTALNLRGKELNGENVLAIANAIPQIPGLIAIDLGGVNLSEDFIEFQIIQQLFKAIKDCKDLLHLSLSLCKLGNQRISSLLDEIILHPALLSLELDENNLSKLSVNSLVTLLRTNNKLISLNLYGNYLGNNRGWDEIAKVMKENHTLLLLSTEETGISSKFENKIDNKIEENLEKFENTVLNDGKFSSFIPTVLIDYLEAQVPDFIRRPLELKFSPVVFIGKWQVEQQKFQRSPTNTKEQPTMLIQYKETQNKINKEMSIDKFDLDKENRSPNTIASIEISYS